MNFLTPLFLFGALAIAAPIIFHLIRRTSREKMTFSSLMFLQPTPPRVTRRSRLENIWLLLLRCLVLCLLTLGFARPFLQRPVADDRSAANGKKLALLIDASASMRRENLWADARAKAEDYLKRASPADTVAVFTFDTHLHALVGFEEWSRMGVPERAALASRKLGETKPGWASTHLGNALIGAVEALQEAQHREAQVQNLRQIVLITDLQEGSHLDGLQGFDWPHGIEVIVEPLKARRPTNAGLQLVTERDAPAGATNGGPRLRVTNATGAKREQFQIGWARNGESGFWGMPVDVYVPPGQSRIIAAPKMPAATGAERMVLRGDDDDFDNTVHWVPPRTTMVNVLYLGEEALKDSTQPFFFLQHAFEPTRQQSLEVNANLIGPAQPLSETNDAQLVILTGPVAEDRLKVVKQMLQDGRSALLVMRTAAAAQTIAGLAGLGSVDASEAPSGGYAMLGQIDFEHPLFAPFADPRFSDFTKIHFWKHRRLETEKLTGAHVLARFDNGDPALVQLPVGKGSLLVLTSCWHPADSQLALSSKFVPLLFSILEQGGGFRVQRSQFLIGDTVLFDDPGRIARDQPVVVGKPDGTQVELARGETRFSQTDQPGVYTVNAAPPIRFAVNLAAEESRTAPRPIEDLEHLRVPLKNDLNQTARQVEARRQHLLAEELERKQKLWKWLLVAALVVLMMESWLAGWMTRRKPVEAGAQT